MTPLYKINLRGSNVWAKLENCNPTGSHKDRSIKPWISHYARQGIKEFAISSSGNSAISAAKYCAENKLKLHAFVSPDSIALPRLRHGRAIMYISRTPRKDAFRFCKSNNIINLRASRDDKALLGYEKIASELTDQLPKIDNIFIPTSSGATLEGIYRGFKFSAKGGCASGGKIQKTPAFFTVQTSKVHPIASYFDKDFISEGTSNATAIVDRVAYRKDRIIKIIRETHGGGFVISNKELGEAKKILHDRARPAASFRELCGGWQSALALAGFLKWSKKNPRFAVNQVSVCLFTD